MRIRLCLLLAAAVLVPACSSASPLPAVDIAGVRSGDEVQSPLALSFRASGFEVRAAGSNRSGEAHFMLVIDEPCVEPGVVPADDEAHRRLTDGTASLRLDLPPGRHDLCLQAVSGGGAALGIVDEVTLYVDVDAPGSSATSSTSSTTTDAGASSTTIATPSSTTTTTTVTQVLTDCPPRDPPAVGRYLRLNEYCDDQVVAAPLENLTFQWGNGVSISDTSDYPTLIVDAPCLAEGERAPADSRHLPVASSPFRVDRLDLEPGTHTLCAQLMDRDGTARATNDRITLTVVG